MKSALTVAVAQTAGASTKLAESVNAHTRNRRVTLGSIWLATLEKNGTKYVKGAATTPDKAVEIARSGLARLVHAADEYDMVEVKVANASAVDRQLPYDFPSDADLDSVKRAIAETDAREIEAEQRRERQAAATERRRQHKAAEAEQRRQREAAEAEQRRQREAAEAEADRAWGGRRIRIGGVASRNAEGASLARLLAERSARNGHQVR